MRVQLRLQQRLRLKTALRHRQAEIFVKLFHLDELDAFQFFETGLMSVEQLYALPDAGTATVAAEATVGLRRLRLRISVATPLLDRETEQPLNPMRITLRGARDLPGVNITSSVQQRSRPDPYRLLQQQCEPTYALLRLFDGDESTGRVVCAPVSPASKVDFGRLSSVFLGGDQDRWLHEQLRTGAYLSGDRDALMVNGRMRRCSAGKEPLLVVGT